MNVKAITATPRPPEIARVIIDLSLEEAKLLKKLLGRIGGHIATGELYFDYPNTTIYIPGVRRKVVDPLFNNLSALGVNY